MYLCKNKYEYNIQWSRPFVYMFPNLYNLSGHKDHESKGLIEEFQTIVADSTGGLWALKQHCFFLYLITQDAVT